MNRRHVLQSALAMVCGHGRFRAQAGQAHPVARQGGWPDPVANDVYPYGGSGLTHGPLLGRPTATSIRVWIRTQGPIPFKVVFDTSLPLAPSSPGVEGHTARRRDNTGFVELERLQPNTRYYYGIVLNGHLADTRIDKTPGFPYFRTLPDASSYRDDRYNPQGLFNLQFSVGFGVRQGGDRYWDPPAYSTMLAHQGDSLMFHIMNGDYIYEHARKRGQTHTIDQFRSDYRIYLERGQSVAHFGRYTPSVYTYDDHETYSDIEGTGEIGLKDGKWLYRDVALGPWYEYVGWANYDGPQRQSIRRGSAVVEKGGDILHDKDGEFSTLRSEAISNIHVQSGSFNAGVYGLVEVIDDHRLRIRPAFIADEADCRYSIGTHHYYDWQVGNCHFFALDTRGERTRYIPKKAHDPDRYVLGEAQVRWLMDGINKSDADFIFIVSSVSWMIYHTNFHIKGAVPGQRSEKEDGFPGFVLEREKLLSFFDEIDKPVLILTGDLHNSFAVQISDNVWEFMCGPMNSDNHLQSTAGNPPYGGWFNSEGREVKIKWVATFPDEVKYTRLRSVYYGVVQVNNTLRSGRQEGPGLHYVAYEAPQVVVQIYEGYTGKLVYAEGISMADVRRAVK